jgi:hypothetical protein
MESSCTESFNLASAILPLARSSATPRARPLGRPSSAATLFTAVRSPATWAHPDHPAFPVCGSKNVYDGCDDCYTVARMFRSRSRAVGDCWFWWRCRSCRAHLRAVLSNCPGVLVLTYACACVVVVACDEYGALTIALLHCSSRLLQGRRVLESV